MWFSLERPFLTLQTLCFTGLPFLRPTDRGLADVRPKGCSRSSWTIERGLRWRVFGLEHIILGLKRTTRDFLDTVVDNLSESIIVTDLEGKIVYFNKGSEMIFGQTGS